jgi:hypothetical protein
MEQSDKYTMFFNVMNEMEVAGTPKQIDFFKQELTYKR